jgi:hypothetical protein
MNRSIGYNLRDNYQNVYNNAVLPLINSRFSVDINYDINRVIRKTKNLYFCELNINYNLVYKWLSESELNIVQKNLLFNPKNYKYIINTFRSEFRETLYKSLTKAQTNNIKLRLKLNEEVFKKWIRNVNLSISESNTNYYEISKQTFIRLFKFDLETIKLLDHTNQCIRPSFPVLLRKPRFLIRKNSWYKSIINNKLETIYFSYEFLNFSLSINCEVI